MPSDSKSIAYGSGKLLLVLFACLAVYLPTTGHGFVMDDEFLVQEHTPGGRSNHMVESWQGLEGYFTTPYWSVATNPDRLYRPVTILSYAVVAQQLRRMFSSEAAPQHWVNVVLNVWAVFLAFLLLGAMRVPAGVALMGSLIFGMHAIHSEAVANIVGRAEILAFCFGAAGSLAFFRCRGGGHARRAGYALLAALCMFLAYSSKESALAWIGFLPVLILVREWRDDARRGFVEIAKRNAKVLVPVLTVPCLAFFWLRGIALSPVGPEHIVDYVANPLFYLQWDERLLTAVMIWGFGLWKVLFPIQLSSDYGAEVFQIVTSPTQGAFLIAALALAAFLIVGMRNPRRHALLLATTACFFGFGFITSNLLFATGVSFAERLYYTPSFALSIAFVWGWENVAAKWRKLFFFTTIVWIAFSGYRILDRNGDWQDTVTLAMHDIDVEEHSIRLAMITAQSFGKDAAANPARLLEAEKILLAIYEFQPLVPRMSQALGAIALRKAKMSRRPRLRQKLFIEAETYFSRGISSPYFNDRTQGPDLHADLSRALKGQGRMFEAMTQMDLSLDLRPGDLANIKAMFDFKLPVLMLRKYVEQAVVYHPREPWIRPKGLLAKAEGRYPAAVEFLSRYLQGVPGDWETRFDLAECLSALGNMEQAYSELKQILDAPQNSEQVRDKARAEISKLRR